MEDAKDATPVLDLSNPDVVTKYRTAAEISNNALKAVAAACVPGALVLDLCKLGDNFINEAVQKTYSKAKGMSKGVAFPTCVSVNHCVCHNSPFEGDTSAISEGDTCKIDMAAHIDGFCAPVAFTVFVVPAGQAVTGPKADAYVAAQTVIDAAIRMVKPGNKNSDVSAAVEKIANSFGVNHMEGVISHQMKQHLIDANKGILMKPTPEQKVEEITFEANEIYCIDVIMSTGEGKCRELDEKVSNVFKRDVEGQYQLKMKASRFVMSTIDKQFKTFPFSIRSLEEPTRAKLGMTECIQHGLLHKYPCMHETPGVELSHFKVCVLVLPSGTQPITGAPDVETAITSEKVVEDADLKALLAEPLATKKKKKKQNKKKAGEGEGAGGD